jgi:hypothetical protein
MLFSFHSSTLSTTHTLQPPDFPLADHSNLKSSVEMKGSSVALGVLVVAVGKCFAQKAVSKSSGPPAFFLQDPTDGMCLAGETYKRCAIDTLWYVTGKPGSYQIHHRLVDESEEDSCLDRAQCHLDESDVQLANCNHCGAKKWNILGDAESGKMST